MHIHERNTKSMRNQAQSSPHILVVDDALDIRESLGQYLRQQGLCVSLVADAALARQQMAQSRIDLVVLDIMMPGEDGLSLCRWMAENTKIPVILLTAMATDMDRIVGLEVGADDYVVKPFNPRLLLARIRAVLRRSPEQDPPQSARVRKFDKWTHDSRTAIVRHENGTELKLTSAENRLLNVFLENPHKVLKRGMLLDLVMSRDEKAFDRAVDNQVGRLRKKIEVDPREPKLLITEWGIGYKLACVVEDSDS